MDSPSLRSRLLEGSGWALAGRILGVSAAVLINALLARLLSPAEMGQYFLVVSLVAAMSILGQLGLPATLVRLIAEALGTGRPARARQGILAGLTLCLLAGAVAALFFLAGGEWIAVRIFHAPAMREVTAIIALWIFFTALQGVIVEIFRGFHDIRMASVLGGVVAPLILACLLGFLWATLGHASLRDAVVLSLGATVTTVLLASALLGRRLRAYERGAAAIPAAELLGAALPILAINLSLFIVAQADLWVVGAFLSKEDAAVYGAVLKMVALSTATHALVVGVVQSSVAELYARKETGRLERVVRTMALVACIPSGLLLLVYMAWGAEVLEVVFGEFYRAGYWPLAILALSHFLGMLTGPAGMVLMMTGHQRSLMVLIAATGALSIVLALLLLRPYGMIGVAVAWGVGGLLQSLGAWWVSRRRMGVRCHAGWYGIRKTMGIPS